MRQLVIQVPSGQGKSVLATAKKHGGVNLLMFEATSDRGLIDAVTVDLDNVRVENFLGELESIPDLHINLLPRGVMALEPRPEEAPQQLTDITDRSRRYFSGSFPRASCGHSRYSDRLGTLGNGKELAATSLVVAQESNETFSI